MKILVVTDTFPVVSQTFIDLHVRSLLEYGHDVRIIARVGNLAANTSDSRQELVERLTPVERPAGSRWRRLLKVVRIVPRDRRSFALGTYLLADFSRGRTSGRAADVFSYGAALCLDESWDVVHVHFGNIALGMAQLASAGFIKAPLIVTFHGSDLNMRKPISNDQFYGRVFQTADMLTVGSQFMKEQLLRCDVQSDQVRVIPMGIDLDRFPWNGPDVRRKAGSRLVTIGRLMEVKGTEYLIRAVAELKPQWPEIAIDIVGDGPLAGDLKGLVQRLDLVSHVTFHGALNYAEVTRILKTADIYVHPGCIAADGTQEGQGLAVAEAAAAGLPVVASRVGGIPEMVAENVSAYLVEPTNVPELAERIGELIANPSLRRTMGASGRAFVEANLDQRRLAQTWLDVYQSLCGLTKRSVQF